MTIDELDPLLHPAHVTRVDGTTVVSIDPTALRVEVAFWTRENLTEAERVVIRMAYDVSCDTNELPPDHLLDGHVHDSDVEIPSLLQMPDARRSLESA